MGGLFKQSPTAIVNLTILYFPVAFRRFPPQDLFHRASNEVFALIDKGPFSRFKVSEEFSYLLKTVGAYEQIDRSEIKVDEIKGGASELAPPKLLDKEEQLGALKQLGLPWSADR